MQPGRPAAWADLPASARRFHPEAVRRLFAVPGAAAVPPRSAAAALVALFEQAGDLRVVLIRRAVALVRNPGEIAFPGGRLEPGETAIDAALREAQEEVGLEPSTVEVLGVLGPVSAATTGSVVEAVVGLLPGRPVLVAAPAEVEAVFDVGLAELCDRYSAERWDGRAMHFFDLGEDLVWGMTARILHILLSMLTSGLAEGGDDRVGGGAATGS